jgi:ribosomal protein S12 methylthiotransferase
LSAPTATSTVSLVHLGCARNLIDSELILGRLGEEGLVVSGDPGFADAVVLNTCSFIGPARDESHAALEGLLDRKRAGDLKHVIVAGCLVQRSRRALAEQYPEVDLFAEISNYRELARSVRRLLDGETLSTNYLDSPGLRPPEREGARMLSTPGSYAYLRISHGCDHTCSFCAIPGIRGKHRSKPLAAVLDEGRELIDGGVSELVLVAEDSTAWGRDQGQELPELVEGLADLEGSHRVRIMYAYPNRFPWRLTDLLRDHPRVIPYLDIPIQHAATPVLRAMRRAGDGDQVRRTLARLQEEVPGLTLRTTVLLGFPGETEADVDELEALVREFRLARMGAFSYSVEEGTSAADLDPQTHPAASQEVVEARIVRVLTIRDAHLAQDQEAQVGRTLEVLVDEGPDSEGWARGRSDQDAPEVDLAIRFMAPGASVGDRVQVKIEGVMESLDLSGVREGS